MRRSRLGLRFAAVCSAVSLVVVTFAIPAGPRVVQAATGSSRGTISGSGTIVIGAETTAVSVSAIYDGSPPSGTLSIATYPTDPPVPSGATPSGPAPSNAAAAAVATAGLTNAAATPILCLWITGSKAVVGGIWDGAPILVWISDGGPAGPDTLELYRDGGPDCTIGPVGFGGTLLASGDFTVTDDVAPADGIDDALQPGGTPAGSFVDTSLAPNTYGSIVSANGLTVWVTDAPGVAGVTITVGSGASGLQAELSICGFTVLLDADSTATATCGSSGGS